MSTQGQLSNRVKSFRQQRGWSQEDVARRAGISRAAVSAIEVGRLVPSVAAALALANAFACRVEDLFGSLQEGTADLPWAWPPLHEPCRFWAARAGGKSRYYPVEPTAAGVMRHDGVFQNGRWELREAVAPERTLVLASCDPAAGLLAAEYARSSGLRLLPLQRSSRQALDLLVRGLVDVAGIHLSSAADPEGNVRAVQAGLGEGYCMVGAAHWEEGLALAPGGGVSTVSAALRGRLRWVGREPGSGARQCLDELLDGRAPPRRLAKDHRGVAEAIRCGWADVGVCLRLASEEAGLRFLSLRQETYELVFPRSVENDPRLRSLLQVLRSDSFRTLLGALPGYSCAETGELRHVN